MGEAGAAIRRVAAEVEAKAKPLLAKIEGRGEEAVGHTNAKVEHHAPAEATPRGPEPEGPGEGGPHSARTGKFPRTHEEYEALAKDPAQGGKSSPKTEQERRVGLDIEERGDVPGPITRDPNPHGADFIDASGRKWDVKGFNSNYPVRQGGFNLVKDADKVDVSLAKQEDVMLDTSKMRPEHIEQLRAEGARRGWGARVLWWP